MQYRKFGKTNEMVSSLGFGCMRLPLAGETPDLIDEKKAISLIHQAIENGVNYFDTAYPYHSLSFEAGGNSEPLLGKALKQVPRDKVKIATKLPSWLVKEHKDMESLLDDQLERLQTSYIDFYLIHALNKGFWQNLKNNDLFGFINKALESGKIKHIGFSFHDDIQLFKEIVDSFPWEFCQIQLNYLDQNYQAGMEGLKYASSKGMGVAIMEPLRGGNLADSIPDEIENEIKTNNLFSSNVDMALSWLWNLPEVSIVLSGMNTTDQVSENCELADIRDVGNLTPEKEQLVKKVIESFESKKLIRCTACGYCLPCPVGVNIPVNLRCYNEYHRFDNERNRKQAHTTFNMFLSDQQKAFNCVKCRKCESHCPQGIKISEELEKVKGLFCS